MNSINDSFPQDELLLQLQGPKPNQAKAASTKAIFGQNMKEQIAQSFQPAALEKNLNAVEIILSNELAHKHLLSVIYKRPLGETFHDILLIMEDNHFLVDCEEHLQFLEIEDPVYSKDLQLNTKEFKGRPIALRRQASSIEKTESQLLWMLFDKQVICMDYTHGPKQAKKKAFIKRKE